MARGKSIRMKQRSTLVLAALVFLGFSMLILRLISLQFFQGEFLSKMASDQQMSDTKISAQRGTIYDANMKPLAQSATVWTVVLEPAYIADDETREIICNGLNEILGIEKEKLMQLAKKKSCYTVVKKKVESDIKDKIIEFKTKNKIASGLRLIEDYKRYYPYGTFASAVLGFTGADDQGLAGVEAFYDKELKGKPGRILTSRNAIGTEMPFSHEEMIESERGNSVQLCIDETIQKILEKNLEEGVANNKVINKATAIAMDVKTGGVLGMAVSGGFDPNEPFKIHDSAEEERINTLPQEEQQKARSEALSKQWRNKAVNDTYYPGSVYKMIVASMALEENLVNENSQFNCTGSIVPCEGVRPIRCHKREGHGLQNFVEAFCHSCNPAFISIGQKIGVEKFFNFYKSFGFHSKTNIDLPGESSDIFFSADGKMSRTDLAVASIGQNFGITPIQMVTAACAIANGGNLVQPHVVDKILDVDGNIVKSFDTTVKRKVISEEVSKKVTLMLQQNVINGGAKNAYVPGYGIGGKTGTSEKIGLSSTPGQKDYISSFCGIIPNEIAVLVMFDTPKGPYYYGSAVAAPVAGKMFEEICSYKNYPKVFTEEEMQKLEKSVPNFVDMDVSKAKAQAQSNSFIPVVIGNGDKVLAQIPSPLGLIPQGGKVILYTDNETRNSTVKVPKLIGLSVFEANRVAHAANLNIKLSGKDLNSATTVSSTQSIAPGTEVPPGTTITVGFMNPNRGD